MEGGIWSISAEFHLSSQKIYNFDKHPPLSRETTRHTGKRYIRRLQKRSYVLGCQRADLSTIGNVWWDFNIAARQRKNTGSCIENIKNADVSFFISVGNNSSSFFVKVRSVVQAACYVLTLQDMGTSSRIIGQLRNVTYTLIPTYKVNRPKVLETLILETFDLMLLKFNFFFFKWAI